MILSLDDISWMFFKKIKSTSDELSKVVHEIEIKSLLLKRYESLWLVSEDMCSEESDYLFKKKYKLEVEIRSLEMKKKSLTDRIKEYVNKKN